MRATTPESADTARQPSRTDEIVETYRTIQILEAEVQELCAELGLEGTDQIDELFVRRRS